MNQGRCEFCGREIDPDRDYQKVEGYIRRRAQGGPNMIRVKREMGPWACVFCIEMQSSGLSAAQGTLGLAY